MGSLPLAPSKESVSLMLLAMTKERDAVKVEKLLCWGADNYGMTFVDNSASVRR